MPKKKTRQQTISEQAREAIRQCGMPNSKLSDLTGVAESMLSRFVNCKRSLTLDSLDRIATVLKWELKTDAPKKGKRK
jgi:plasmid maintenance system antidote protein VapI